VINKLEAIAREVRQAIDLVISESDYVDCELQSFPSGSCELSSVIVGLYLNKVGITDVVQTVARRPIPDDINTNDHVWLTIDGKYIVDITADQFDDCNVEVIVSEGTDFHNTFEIYDTRPVDFSYLMRSGSEGYDNFYSSVLAKLQNT